VSAGRVRRHRRRRTLTPRMTAGWLSLLVSMSSRFDVAVWLRFAARLRAHVFRGRHRYAGVPPLKGAEHEEVACMR